MCKEVLHKVYVATPLYWYSSSSKNLVIFETAIICRSMCWFPVFCARRRNESRDAETLLVIGQANSLKQLRISVEGQRNVVFITKHQTWGHYSTNVSNRLRILATCSITITNKQNHNVIDYDSIVSNHDYNRDYICLETSSERKKKNICSFM